MNKEEPSNENEDSVKLRSEMMQTPTHNMHKFRFIDNVFVPLGCFATISALAVGLWSFRKGRSKLSQNMMQYRIIAQSFTVAALVVSFFTAAKKTIK